MAAAAGLPPQGCRPGLIIAPYKTSLNSLNFLACFGTFFHSIIEFIEFAKKRI
jgi:hypothetical protein